MTCLLSGAGLRRSYQTMVHSSPQRSLLTSGTARIPPANRVTPHCTTGRTPAELMLGHQVRSSLSVLQPRAHKAKLQQKLPAKPKYPIGEHVHYRDFTRNRPKWVAGKVTGHVGMKLFIVQGPDGHCRLHEDQLK